MSQRPLAVGRHLFIGLNGDNLTAASRHLLQTVQPGGVVLFARNIRSAEQLQAFIGEIQAALPYRPLIAIDQENKRVNRLRDVVGEIASVAELIKTGRAKEFGRWLGGVLRQCRVDLDFAPVLDLELFDAQTDNALRERCWGRTAAAVSQWAGAFLDALHAAGVAGCAKHFPGLGGATQDSHEHLPVIRRSRERLLAEDVAPYAALLPRLPAIMVGHGHYPAFDGEQTRPASLSRAVVTDLLRRQMGYDGLVVTDDLEMGAIAQWGTFEQAVVAALAAGADMLLVCHTAEKILAAHAALAGARIPTEESARRIEEFKQKWIGPKN